MAEEKLILLWLWLIDWLWLIGWLWELELELEL